MPPGEVIRISFALASLAEPASTRLRSPGFDTIRLSTSIGSMTSSMRGPASVISVCSLDHNSPTRSTTMSTLLSAALAGSLPWSELPGPKKLPGFFRILTWNASASSSAAAARNAVACSARTSSSESTARLVPAPTSQSSSCFLNNATVSAFAVIVPSAFCRPSGALSENAITRRSGRQGKLRLRPAWRGGSESRTCRAQRRARRT